MVWFFRWSRTLALASLLAFSLSQNARAQSCHTAPNTHLDELTFGAELAFSAAKLARSTPGEYQGLTIVGSVQQRWFAVAVAVPGYRLASQGTTYGLGDVALSSRVPIIRDGDDKLRSGVLLGTTFPSGDADEGLGMGHYMLMPGIFVSMHTSRWRLGVDLSYGRAVGSQHKKASLDHSQHGGAASAHVGPLVNPMNRSELEHVLELEYQVLEALRLVARLLGAVPIAQIDGLPREVIAVGLRTRWRSLSSSLEVQVPVVGSPFAARTVLSMGANW